MIVVGLTGSIGMGKSTTAALFAELGAVVMDSDTEVRALYAPGSAFIHRVLEQFPSALGDDGGIDRGRLSVAIAGRPDSLQALEDMVHPLVLQRRHAFLAEQAARGTFLVVLEIQLLFETGRQSEVDKTVVVTAPATVQRLRALDRPGMTEEKLTQILRRQMSDAEKRARADFVIDTGKSVDDARRQVATVVAALAGNGERQH